MKKNILVSGGGIAGLTVASYLSKQGHDITVIDKATSFSKAGFLISLKSFGVQIMDELGLTESLRDEASPSGYMRFLEANDQLIQHLSYDKVNEHIEKSVLISRGGLHHVLYEAIKNDVYIQFNTTISELVQGENTTTVTLSDGKVLEADLVIIAEGLRSTTRDRYFKDSKLNDFNILYMGGRLQQPHSYTVGSFNVYIDVHKMLSVYPIAPDEIAIQCYIHHTGDVTSIRQHTTELLQQSFGGYNPEIQDLLNRFARNGMIFADKMGMVEAPDLVQGNLVLLGDAGYCPTALSGMGASLSIYGAKALAHFIGKTPHNLQAACRDYNTLMQPIIQKFQGNARNNAASFIPDNEAKLKQFVQAFRMAGEEEIQRIMTAPIVLTPEQLEFTLNT